ncbi:SdpA family antimicrobial peptide system protein [Catenulispora rubra]|uniref:SdpA family antimicrobial peptide system protein n=1 Tax=Catenulispora rubra TaxID=280293 RepID=UPI00226455AB|nr:SdpA family antimicrobial peptide system protein [Catenulispora rubra]
MPRPVVSEGSAMSVLWPQGWNFYASEPTQTAVVAYRVGDGGGLTAVTVRQMSARTDLGLSRAGSAQLVELGNISAGLPRTAWQDCVGLDPQVCESRTLTRSRSFYRDATSHATLCGHTLIAVVDPDPGRLPNGWGIEECANVYVECAA